MPSEPEPTLRLTRLVWDRSMSLRLAVAFVAAYVALDWISFVHPMRGVNVTPWNPQAALAVGLLLVTRSAWWLVWIAPVASELVGRPAASELPGALLSGAGLAAGYVVTGALLARALGAARQLEGRRDFGLFVLAIVVGSLATAALHVAGLGVGATQPGRFATAVYRDWIGQAVGLLVTLPLLIALADPRQRERLAAMARTAEWWLTILAAALAIAVVFGRGAAEQFKTFYLLFVPVVWAAARFGVVGAAVATCWVQALIMFALQWGDPTPLTVFEFQLLVAALAATGLLLGTTVEEREAAERRFRESQRAAAAGEVAAALAHELNQPLAALSGYARACQLMVAKLGNDEGTAPLVDTASKLVAEANRASQVVRRLRGFLRDRTASLEFVALDRLFADVVEQQRPRADAAGVSLRWSCEPGLEPVRVDPVQIAVVLRNLVENGIDAVANGGAPPRGVSIEAHASHARVLVTVADTGAGVPPGEVDSLFDAGRSGKPGGMGIGLALSRTIVHAHGGRLWAEPGPGGRFMFTLPLEGAG
ncbi:MASE1 domain-containing protein [Ramlibacter sp.]|uniref:sensor histidine kinase n=1 Tax=Ramlibacter sp. TaxID=1917967 RepID=UPI003D0C1697